MKDTDNKFSRNISSIIKCCKFGARIKVLSLLLGLWRRLEVEEYLQFNFNLNRMEICTLKKIL